jgi:predicted DNA-binding protein
MSSLSRRVQVLLDDERAARLDQESARTGRSVGALIRTAIDRVYGTDAEARTSAAEAFLAADPHEIGDWEAEKAAVRDGFFRVLR